MENIATVIRSFDSRASWIRLYVLAPGRSEHRGENEGGNGMGYPQLRSGLCKQCVEDDDKMMIQLDNGKRDCDPKQYGSAGGLFWRCRTWLQLALSLHLHQYVQLVRSLSHSNSLSLTQTLRLDVISFVVVRHCAHNHQMSPHLLHRVSLCLSA